MSSHHIVRDQQEPALIVEDISHFPLKVLTELLGWSPTVVCLENSIDQFINYGLKLDCAIVSPQNKSRYEAVLSHQWPFQMEIMAESVMDQSISYLKKRNHQAINIITSEERKLATLEKVIDFAQIDFSIFTEESRHLVYREKEYSKWLTKDTRLNIRLWGDSSDISYEGLTLLPTSNLEHGVVPLKATRDGQVKIKVLASEAVMIISEFY